MLNEMAKEIHENAVARGWWEEERKLPEVLMLCVSELSEALEEYRSGRPVEWYACEEVKSEKTHACNPKDEYDCTEYGNEAMCRYRGRKPEGIGTELADCIIRILDYCGYAGIDIDGIMGRKMEYNKSRPYRHGGKVC